MYKVALIIGGTGELGAACARDLSGDYKIIVAGRNKEKGHAIVSTIQAAGGEATFLPFDICNFASIQNFHANAVKIYGRLDAAINGAGIIGPFQKLNDFSVEEITHVLNTNLTGVILCLQAQIASMQANPSGSGGRIVNFSSIYGLHGTKWGSIYAATKHALVGLTNSAALEYGGPHDDIQINCINPGHIKTELTAAIDDPSFLPEEEVKEDFVRVKGFYAQGRFGEVEDVARGVRFLLESPWATGTCLEVDGGFGAK